MSATATRPNIILINCDDLGYGDLGCYGSKVNRTPALDRLAAEGVRFTNFYMASPICSPSRGAMMTGCYPRRIGFENFEGRGVLFPGQGVGLHQDEITVAELLKQQGYATQIVGKWHCGDQPEFLPTRHGFDHYYGIPYSNDMGIQSGPDRGRPPLPLVRDEQLVQAQPDQANLIERYTEECVRFIREKKDQPFFLYLAHMQVHLPLYAPQRFVDNSRNGRYGACVEAVDWSTSVLMYELDRLGLAENTIVMFTSDNGSRNRDEGGSNAPLRGHKAQTWEGGQRVPFIVRWPERIRAGAECHGLASAIDLLPTLTNLAGGQVPDDRTIDGVDLAPLLDDPSADSPREVFFYYQYQRLEAVRCGHWKLFVSRRGEPVSELYDLQSDIGETTNLIERRADIAEELMKHVQAMRADIGDKFTGTEGANCRPLGRVENPTPITGREEDYPYIIAEYDLPNCG